MITISTFKFHYDIAPYRGESVMTCHIPVFSLQIITFAVLI